MTWRGGGDGEGGSPQAPAISTLYSMCGDEYSIASLHVLYIKHNTIVEWFLRKNISTIYLHALFVEKVFLDFCVLV
jgi:hypothetical protein